MLDRSFYRQKLDIHKRILNFCPNNSHKGESIGLAIELCLRDWDIITRVSTCTVDNASSNDVALVNDKWTLYSLGSLRFGLN